MKIEWNESEEIIEINDGLQKQYLILKVLMGINLFNASLQLIGKPMAEYEFLQYLWLVVGFISLLALFLFVFKTSGAQKISITEIHRLEEKTVFGKTKVSLLLNNGKRRNLGSFKDPSELEQMRGLFKAIGIAS